ncbi:LysM peptidoglycan-binding domain-containing protein [Lacisediminihabitans sp.]|uniref:LysM peptidoglycan-binding domain-containing protein n=1 Tax=Lacisediminihabitans sp. TaxID=2787631 RepID=UPI00374C9E32
MTSTFDQGARHAAPKDRSRLSRNLMSTLPIVLAGSMAMSMTLTGPIDTADAKPPAKPRSSPSELGKTIREAFAAATRAAANPTPITVSEAQTSTAAAPATYKVAAGDSVSSIAGRFGLATASVLALNGLGWKSVIFPGQVLKLTSGGPVPVAAPVVGSPTSRYTIAKGDTISHIAARFGVSVQNLLSANGLGWASIIYPGQTLAIPGASTAAVSSTPIVAAPAPAKPTVAPGAYVIATGDTIAGIASRFGVTTGALLAANGLSWSSIIYTGRSLVIPAKPIVPAASVTPSIVLTAEMATNAKTIIRVGRSLGVPDYGLVVALAAAAQESGLRNLNYGDRDSLGLFQQRPSTGWGSPAQILDPSYAARLFFGGPKNPNAANTRGLLDIPGWKSKTVTQAAQSVQLSAFPDAYAKWETGARAWLKDLG